MNRETSIYLDAVRIAAALAVMLGHAAFHRLTGGRLWHFLGHGREAVDVFFVLSGFVIAHTIANREGDVRVYTAHRLARIYSVALPALAASLVFDAIGRAVEPGLYQGWCCAIGPGLLRQYLGGLTFTGDIWRLHSVPGSNIPYWSLDFEIWYYVAAGIALFGRRPWNWLGAMLMMLAVGPRIAVLFPLWWLGFALQRLCAGGALRLTPARGAVLAGGALLVFILYEAVATRHGEIYDPLTLSAARLHDLAQDYIVGGLFAVHLLGFRAASVGFAGRLERIAPWVRYLSRASFPLYLFHLPLMTVLVALSPWPARSWATVAMVVVVPPLGALGGTPVPERRREAWRRLALSLRGAPRAARSTA